MVDVIYQGWTPSISQINKIRTRIVRHIGQAAFAGWIAEFPDVVIEDEESYESILRMKIAELDAEYLASLERHWSDDLSLQGSYGQSA